MKFIVINGAGGVGKNTFIDFCKEGDYDVYDFSTIDSIKKIARTIGWDGVKDAAGRRFLSDIKDAMTLYNDGPFKEIIGEVNRTLYVYEEFEQPTDNVIFFIQCREPEEIARWAEEYNAKTLLIRRDVEEEFDNHADQGVFDYDYDYVYSNVGDLEQLKREALSFINFIGEKSWKSDGPDLQIWDR